MGRGAGRNFVQNAIFHGKRHDDKILKVKILLSRNIVVMAQAPKATIHFLIRHPLTNHHILLLLLQNFCSSSVQVPLSCSDSLKRPKHITPCNAEAKKLPLAKAACNRADSTNPVEALVAQGLQNFASQEPRKGFLEGSQKSTAEKSTGQKLLKQIGNRSQ